MNALTRALLVIAFMAGMHSAGAAPADARAVEAEVSKLDAGRIDALLKADLKALEQLYSDDLAYIHSNGRVDTKQQYLAGLAAGNLTYVSIKYEPAATIRTAGRDTAIVTGRMQAETKNKAGQLTKRVLTTTTVYVRSPAGWRVISYQGTPIL